MLPEYVLLALAFLLCSACSVLRTVMALVAFELEPVVAEPEFVQLIEQPLLLIQTALAALLMEELY